MRARAGIVVVLLSTLSAAFAGHSVTTSGFRAKCLPSRGCSRNSECPPGLFCVDGCCECGSCPQDISKCNGTHLLTLDCVCVTYDNNTDITSVGTCMYKCGRQDSMRNTLYFPVPENKYQTCSFLNRTGTLCGRCLPGHYPLAYSFNVNCIPCPHAHWNWVKYIAAAYLPLTLFYFVVLFFKINTTSSNTIFVCFCQSLSLPVIVREVLLISSSTHHTYVANAFFKVGIFIYGIWNLDFFRPFYTDLCLGIGILPTLALDYAIAVYPLLLMVVTYLLIVLYDKNYRLITLLWRPFQILFLCFRKNWNIKTSLIDAFATFFFLSNVKFLSVSFDLLVPTRVYQIQPHSHPSTWHLYTAGDIEYFGKEHLPYAILAIVVLCIFALLPVIILALYPFCCFQKLLNLLPLRWYILHTFVDAFQGCYKDGTEPGTRDYRWFASLYFIYRIIILLVYSVTLNSLGIMINGLFLMILALLFVTLKPFKFSFAKYNVINAVFVQFLAFTFFSSTGLELSTLKMYKLLYFFTILIGISGCIPLIYVGMLISAWSFKKRGAVLRNIASLKSLRKGYQSLETVENVGTVSCDRIENPTAYPKQNLSCLVVPK